jgi:hypothetical protein
VNEAPPLSTFSELLARLEAAVEVLEKQTPDDPLDVGAVRARYGLADDRTARGLMHEAGALRVGGRLFVRRCDLERLEVARIEHNPPARSRQGAGRQREPGRRQELEELEPGFWRE